MEKTKNKKTKEKKIEVKIQLIPFEDRIPDIKKAISKRRPQWRVAALDFEDVEQIVMTRVFLKYHTFDVERGEFSHWLSRVISNAIKNVLRENLFKWSRPCISGCAFNMGGDECSKTSSGKQCDECVIYKNWKKRKESHFQVKQTLPMENHMQEVNNKPTDSIDVQAAKNVIDEKIKDKLTEHEYKIYRLLYVDNKTEEEVGILMGYKKTLKMGRGYQIFLGLRKKIISASKEIIEDEDLA